eukprot:TRINITY_DN1401_c0_g2_i2.p1 TRINITY_DN1401_c0_g2~~TRINITY_DN1401_c0_g2_i2.p1  ORF type:complete len:308 (-),score=56.89 TRINITY_DN1401_c0_g2_i2:335-1258(-)
MLISFLTAFFFFFKQKTAYEMLRSLVGSEMCIRDSINAEYGGTPCTAMRELLLILLSLACSRAVQMPQDDDWEFEDAIPKPTPPPTPPPPSQGSQPDSNHVMKEPAKVLSPGAQINLQRNPGSRDTQDMVYDSTKVPEDANVPVSALAPPLGHIRGLADQLVQKEPGSVTDVRPWVCSETNEYRTPRRAGTAILLEIFLGPTGAANFYYGNVLAGVARTMLLLASVMLCCVKCCCRDSAEQYETTVRFDHFDKESPPVTPRKQVPGGLAYMVAGAWTVLVLWWVASVVQIGSMSLRPTLENSCLVEF